MKVLSLSMTHFRNFSSEQLSFGERFNIFVGKNAQGKTNILEALFLFATGSSFRTSEFRNLIQWQEPRSFLEAEVDRPEGKDVWSCSLTAKEKQIHKNGKALSSRFKRGLDVVLFSPEEILLLRDLPSARRAYIDHFVSRFLPQHRPLVRNYEKILSHRNAILKDDLLRDEEKLTRLKDWNRQLLVQGTQIILIRASAVDELNLELQRQYASIVRKDEEAAFVYMPFCGKIAFIKGEIESRFEEHLDRRARDELIRRISLVGPQRDDFIASLSGNAIAHFGSQGEHRSFILAMKVAELELTSKKEGAQPLFLLDDVASELDEARNASFFEYLQQSQGQIFITTTDIHQIRFSSHDHIKLFNVSAGKVKSLLFPL